MIEHSKLRLALKRLQEQHENHRTCDASLPEITREGIAESVIIALYRTMSAQTWP